MSHNNLIRIIKLSGFIACAIIFIFLAILIYFNRVEPIAIDVVIRDFAYKIRGEKYGFVYWLARIVTEFGYFVIIVLFLLFAAFYTKLDFQFFLLLFGVMLSLILNVGMKDMYSRERPYTEMRWMAEDTTSFPSGHSTVAGFLYSFLIYLTYHTNFKKWLKSVIYVVCLLLMFLVMASRIILGVHYFTDVIAGCATGVMVSCLCMLLYRYCANNNILTTGILNRKDKNEKN